MEQHPLNQQQQYGGRRARTLPLLIENGQQQNKQQQNEQQQNEKQINDTIQPVSRLKRQQQTSSENVANLRENTDESALNNGVFNRNILKKQIKSPVHELWKGIQQPESQS